jgi:hypothetical protein
MSIMFESKAEPIILPERYYHHYFCELLAFVQKHSPHLIGPSEWEFLSAFNLLTQNAQCLFIRFCNRKGPYFRLDKLTYSEISDINGSIEDLENAHFIVSTHENNLELYRPFTKRELQILFAEYDLNKLSKDAIIELLYEKNGLNRILAEYQLVLVAKQEEVEFLKMLYFGKYKKQMTEFVIRDVGYVKLAPLDETQFTPWFIDRTDAMAAFELSKLLRLVRVAISEFSGTTLHEALKLIPWNDYLISIKTQQIGDQIMLLVGQHLERQKQPVLAIRYYQLAKKHPARERQLRIWHKLGQLESATQLALEIMKNHWNASEYLFAKDFLDRQKTRINRSTSQLLKSANKIDLYQNTLIKVEEQALSYYKELGFDGIHGENQLWKNLYGLLFWDQLFDQQHGDYHHPLQRVASDFYTKSFYMKRKKSIMKRLESFEQASTLAMLINITFNEKFGIANPMVQWEEKLSEHLEVMINKIPLVGLKKVLIEMSKNLKDNTTGFPDLFIWNEHSYHLYEIKSPNDHLSSQQLYWLDFFKKEGIHAEIIKVNFL